MFCERNKKIALKKLSVLTTVENNADAVNSTHVDHNMEANKDEEKDEENKQKAQIIKNEQVVNSKFLQRKQTIVPVLLLGRSSSLTCTETVDNISVSSSYSSSFSLRQCCSYTKQFSQYSFIKYNFIAVSMFYG